MKAKNWKLATELRGRNFGKNYLAYRFMSKYIPKSMIPTEEQKVSVEATWKSLKHHVVKSMKPRVSKTLQSSSIHHVFYDVERQDHFENTWKII